MTLRSAVLIPFLQRVFGRRVTLDPEIPIGLLIERMLAVTIGLARGLLLTRRALALEKGARISDLARFRTSGGLVRIGAHSLIECASREGIKVGQNFKLGAFSRMIASGTLSELGKGISVGDNVGIGEFAYIGGAGGVRIGSDVIVGQYFSVHPENHVFMDLNLSIREQGVTRAGIEVGEGCWIGAKVTLTDGVSVGRHSVIAAGSVVTRSFPEYSIIGGVPARLLRSRVDLKKDENV